MTRDEATKEVAAIRIPRWLSPLSVIAPSMVVLCVWGGASVSAWAVREFSAAHGVALAGVAAMPLVFGVSFVAIAGAIARTAKGGIVAGQFPRRPDHPIYALRRVYGAAWTQLYYFRPLYAAVLAVPPLRALAFRMFGYTGSLKIVVYPDSWIRDLPLLDVGRGVYIGNRCVLGTNICLNDGTIVTGKVTLEDDVMIGHLAIVGTFNRIGRGSTIGVRASLGFAVVLGERVEIGPECAVSHRVRIGNDVRVGTRCHIGERASISSGLIVPNGVTIPDGMTVSSQSQIDVLARSVAMAGTAEAASGTGVARPEGVTALSGLGVGLYHPE